jgi:methionine sulfoxide reductase heme-binding subunit
VIPALIAPPSPIWFFARGAGFVSLILLTVSVCLGILLSMRVRSRSWPLFLSDQLHGYTALLFFLFLALHVVTVLLDPFTKFGLSDVLLPFASTYRRVWLGLGVVAAELAVAMGASVYLRRWIGYRAWRILHLGTYAVFPMALVHGLATGTDTRAGWGTLIYALCLGAVVGAAAARLWTGPPERFRGPVAAAGALGIFVLGSWLTVGPMHQGWAREAGTPQLDRAQASPSAPAQTPSPLALARPFVDQVSGRLDPQSGSAVKASGQATGSVDLGWSLDAQQAADGSLTGTLTITDASGNRICVASITSADQQGIQASCTPRGAQGSLIFDLRLRQRAGSLMGQLAVDTGLAGSPGPTPTPSAPGVI